ncbi:MAG: HutP family protein [Peptococcaceae bacterium]|nr:HutP family protein [Peptococcaceae bacterium]
MNLIGSRKVSKVALVMALSESREEERALKADFAKTGISTAAVDCGGEFSASVSKIIERAVVAAKREGVIRETFAEEGAVAGAVHEALTQVTGKAIGLNIGGKIGIAREGENLAVALFLGVGLLHLDEVAVGLGHRVIGTC